MKFYCESCQGDFRIEKGYSQGDEHRCPNCRSLSTHEAFNPTKELVAHWRTLAAGMSYKVGSYAHGKYIQLLACANELEAME